MWQEVPNKMRWYNIGPVNSFDENNYHDGVCWGWPYECKLTNNQAKAILLAIWKKKTLTYSMMKGVRKSLAYAFELTGGAPGKNYPGVAEVWAVVREDKLPESTTTTLPERVPSPRDLKKAFTTPWTPECSMSFMEHSTGLVAGYDCFCFGLRSREDVKKVKGQNRHHFDWEKGWQYTDLVGGRAKLCGNKKGSRPWKVWTVCFCKGSKHRRPPADFYKEIDEEGNPVDEIPFSTVCPLAALEVIWQLQDAADVPRRRYGKWLGSGHFGVSNYGDVVEHAIDWFVAKGTCTEETRYSSNAGRKCLGSWTGYLRIEYELSFEIHGDLWEVWSKHYETTMLKSNFKRRTQSTTPKVACLALRRLANYFGYNKKVKRKLTTDQRYMHHILVQQGKQELAEKIRDGIPSDSEEDESEE